MDVIYKYIKSGTQGEKSFRTLEDAMREAYMDSVHCSAYCYEIITKEKTYNRDAISKYLEKHGFYEKYEE